MADDDDFCPICMIEGQSECEEHSHLMNDDDRNLDTWHDEWERDNFGDN